jgi:hypothetical protein
MARLHDETGSHDVASLTRSEPATYSELNSRAQKPFAQRPLMPDIFEALQAIARDRVKDPLSPVTVITPSHAAALQLRRRLAAHGPFAAVRFETLPRVAELLGAGRLAASGRVPLARPIGDYACEMVARESRGVLAQVGELPGYARVLRQIFRRLRRGGVRSARDVRTERTGHLGEPCYEGLLRRRRFARCSGGSRASRTAGIPA